MEQFKILKKNLGKLRSYVKAKGWSITRVCMKKGLQNNTHQGKLYNYTLTHNMAANGADCSSSFCYIIQPLKGGTIIIDSVNTTSTHLFLWEYREHFYFAARSKSVRKGDTKKL